MAIHESMYASLTVPAKSAEIGLAVLERYILELKEKYQPMQATSISSVTRGDSSYLYAKIKLVQEDAYDLLEGKTVSKKGNGIVISKEPPVNTSFDLEAP